jgi:hypothetical protein
VRLPKTVEADPRAAGLVQWLAAHARPLWSGASLQVAQVEPNQRLTDVLASAHAAGRIVRGFDEAERVLAAEARGLAHVDRRTDAPTRGSRVSRLLLLADDGSERFYRNVESMLSRHAPRVLALRLATDERGLGALLFGPEQVARLLLVEHKASVSECLLALAPPDESA